MAKYPAQRRTQAERREETRSRIIEAAISELLHNGYAGIRVDKVAIAAKVSRGAAGANSAVVNGQSATLSASGEGLSASAPGGTASRIMQR